MAQLQKAMTNGPEWKLILLFTLPIMAGNLLQQLYSTVDSVVVGNYVSEQALSAIGTCTPLTLLFLALAIGLGVGAGIVVSQYYGAGETAKTADTINTAVILMGAVGLLLTLVALAITPFLLETVLSVPQEILPLSSLYFRVYCLGLFFQFIYNCIASVLRSVGDSRATLYFLTVSSLLNIGLDLLFVIVFHWGVGGAAVATVISQLACAVISYLYMLKKLEIQPSIRAFSPALCKLILRLGIPSAVQQCVVAMGNVAMQRLVNSFGPPNMAAYTAGSNIERFIFVPALGFQAGMSTFCGQNAGAGKWDRIRRGLHSTILMTFLASAIIGSILFLFAGPIIALFNLEGESLTRGIELLRYIAPIFWIFSVYMAFVGTLQGAGDVMFATAGTLTALTVRVITGYLGVALGLLDYEAAWVTMPIGWLSAFVIVLTRYLSGRWKAKVLVKRPPPTPEEV